MMDLKQNLNIKQETFLNGMHLLYRLKQTPQLQQPGIQLDMNISKHYINIKLTCIYSKSKTDSTSKATRNIVAAGYEYEQKLHQQFILHDHIYMYGYFVTCFFNAMAKFT